MAVVRELSASYGGHATTPCGKIRIEKGYERSVVEWDFIVSGDSHAAFAAACVAAESAFRKPRQTLTISQGGATLFTLGTSNSGFDADPSLSKGDDVLDSGRARVYHARVEFGMPADTGAEDEEGLRSSSVEVSYSPARRRTLTISGVFTAKGANQSRAQYDAKIDAFTGAVRTALGGVWEKIDQRDEHNTADTLLEFTQVFRERISDEGEEGTLNDTAIVEQHLKITRRKENAEGWSSYAEGGYGGSDVDPISIFSVAYEAWIDKDETTDLEGKYAAIRPWLLDRIDDVASSEKGAGTWALVEEEPTFDYDDNRISSRLVAHAVGKTDVLENIVTVTDNLQVGRRLVAIWTGRPLEKYAYDGPAVFRRTVRQVLKRQGYKAVGEGNANAYAVALGYRNVAPSLSPLQGSTLQFDTIDRTGSVTHKKKGLDSKTYDYTEIEATTTFEGFIPYGGAGYGDSFSRGGRTETTPTARGESTSGGEVTPPTVNRPGEITV